MRLAGLSIDADSVSSHLVGYGFVAPADDGAAYRCAIPRALDVLQELGARCTFFLIAQEAVHFPSVVRAIVAAGHEIGSHSMTHRLPFAALPAEDLRREVADSKATLEELAGQAVVGFRAPSWDVSAAVLREVARAGYRYDASTYPSILLPILRRAIAKRSSGGQSLTASNEWKQVFGRAWPHDRAVGDGSLWEIPTSTTPILRLPYYHTLRFAAPDAVVRMLGRLTTLRRSPINYQFHAVDFLGLEEDALDDRIGRHPGMGWSLDRKLAAAREAIQQLRGPRRIVALIDIVDEMEQRRVRA